MQSTEPRTMPSTIGLCAELRCDERWDADIPHTEDECQCMCHTMSYRSDIVAYLADQRLQRGDD